jgi:glycosyltransferase involved in cell wall biosynthesis
MCREQDLRSSEKIKTIWNGINLDRFVHRGPKPVPTAISVARLSPLKDFPTLLRAVPLVLPYVPDFRLRIVGDGSERVKLAALIDELRIGPHVELLGERHDVPELLAESGFFVSSSLSEGISLTLLEAMAVGLPVVTTSVGGKPEIVIDGQTGRLTPSSDPAALARAIIEMCNDSDVWAAMSLLARQRVEQHFDIRQMIQSYEAMYEELLGTGLVDRKQQSADRRPAACRSQSRQRLGTTCDNTPSSGEFGFDVIRQSK